MATKTTLKKKDLPKAQLGKYIKDKATDLKKSVSKSYQNIKKDAEGVGMDFIKLVLKRPGYEMEQTKKRFKENERKQKKKNAEQAITNKIKAGIKQRVKTKKKTKYKF